MTTDNICPLPGTGKTALPVAHVSFSGDFGGREKVALSLHKGMRQAGHASYLYLIIEERHGLDRNANLMASLGPKEESWRLLRTASRFSWKTCRELRDWLKVDHIRTVHCHCYKSLFYTHLLRTMGMLHATIVYTLHGLVLQRSWNALLVQAAQYVGLRLCDGVIGCSKEILVSSLGKSWTRPCTTIINAVEAPFTSYEEIDGVKAAARAQLVQRYGLNADWPIVINVGRLCPQKNFSLYLRLIKYFQEHKKLQVEANYLLLGNGALESELKAEAGRLGVSNSVVFTGFVADMPLVFAGADMLVQTSTWEGTPMCLLEAQSFGLPAVVPDVGGNSDVIKHGQNGALYPVGDLEELSRQVSSYLLDPALRVQHGRSALENIQRSFSIPDWISKHIHFYINVLNKKNLISTIKPLKPNRPLRILHVVYSFGIGGSECVAREVALVLKERGHVNMMVALEHDGPLSAELNQQGVATFVVDRAAKSMIQAMRDIARICREFRPDVIHTHHMYMLFYTVPAALLARIPIVHTEHEFWSLDTKKGRLLMPILGRFCRKITAVNDDTKNFMADTLRLQAHKLETIINGIDLRRFNGRSSLTRAQLGLGQTDKVAMIVARLEPVKNHTLLLRAWRQVVQQEPQARLLIVGEGSEATALKAQAETLQLADHVVFLGPRRDVHELLPLADLVVLSSRNEGLPMSLLEAMAVGLPVVATDVGGVSKLVVDAVNGRLVPGDDDTALAAAILDLFTQTALAENMGVAGLELVRKHYNLELAVDRYEQMYAQ